MTQVLWVCPKCKSAFTQAQDVMICTSCKSRFDIIGGIPDLRIPGPSWVDYERDRAFARDLIDATQGFSTEHVIRHVYASREHWDEESVNRRTRQVVAAPTTLHNDIQGWLRPCFTSDRLFLDLGCGPGMLLAAAAARGYQGIGIDVSLTWLIVAQRLIADYGGQPQLAAALAESLPLADGSVGSVVSLDVIEHVAEPGSYLREIDRVVGSKGFIALSTPNRFSLTPEPHVGIWGVGWLPRALQKKYVTLRGKDYDYVQLLSTREVAAMLQRHTQFTCDIVIPRVSTEEINHFSPVKSRLATLYNRLVVHSWTRYLFLMIGPFFQVIGKKH